MEDLFIDGPIGASINYQNSAGANGPAEYKRNNNLILNSDKHLPHPILDIYKDSPVKFRFHVLGLPHTAINDEHISCAYTAKQVKFIKMMSPYHKVYAYGNEGSIVPDGVELCTILSEKERQSFGFAPGAFDTATAPLKWESNEMYWRAFGLRCASYLISRVQPGDFICAVGGGWSCYQHAVAQFPGCNRHGSTNALFIDYGSGHYGYDTDFVAYESATWREHIHGKYNSHGGESYCDAVIPNYFELDDFVEHGTGPNLIGEPYYLFIGRLIESKRWKIAMEVTKQLGIKLILAGQGDPGKLDSHVINFGLASKEQRKWLYSHAIASFVPTQYTPPFEGVSIEAMLSGTPSITSDHGAFCENIDSKFRCSTLREYIEAAKYAQTMTMEERSVLRRTTQDKFSLESIRPLFERWLHRLWLLRHGGWGELRDFKDLL